MTVFHILFVLTSESEREFVLHLTYVVSTAAHDSIILYDIRETSELMSVTLQNQVYKSCCSHFVESV
jgi:hypothetical protein